jgi:chromosome segregation ATPase
LDGGWHRCTASIFSHVSNPLFPERVSELSDEVAEATKQLKIQEEQAEEAITLWEANCSDLEDRLSKAEFELSVSSQSLSRNEWVIEQLRSTNEHNSIKIEELQAYVQTITVSESDELVLTKEKMSELQSTLITERQALEEEREKLIIAQDDYEALSKTFDELKTDSLEIVEQWTSKFGEYLSTFSSTAFTSHSAPLFFCFAFETKSSCILYREMRGARSFRS